MDALPNGAHIKGDNASQVTEKPLTPFSGAEANEELKSNCNFFVSQCRIRIEMAFERLVDKWRIPKTPLCVRLKNAGKAFRACALLHNHCINEGEYTPMIETTDTDRCLAEHPHLDMTVTRQSGTSFTRDDSAEEVADRHLGRPPRNSQQNYNDNQE